MAKMPESRGQKAGRKRFGTFTPEKITECAEELREISAALQVLAREMQKAELSEIRTDGAQQPDRGLGHFRDFRKNVAMAIAKAKAEK